MDVPQVVPNVYLDRMQTNVVMRLLTTVQDGSIVVVKAVQRTSGHVRAIVTAALRWKMALTTFNP